MCGMGILNKDQKAEQQIWQRKGTGVSLGAGVDIGLPERLAATALSRTRGKWNRHATLILRLVLALPLGSLVICYAVSGLHFNVSVEMSQTFINLNSKCAHFASKLMII